MVDLDVEQPSTVFKALRHDVELALLHERDLTKDLRSESPPWQLLQVWSRRLLWGRLAAT